MQVTAEGVERADQASSLRQRGCDQIQGFLVSPAVPPDQLPAMMGGWSEIDGFPVCGAPAPILAA